MMELYQLKYFTAVAQAQHFTRAAKMLHIAQPSLSKSIAKLEDELGVPLFERDKKTVYLTDYGRVLLRHAERILSQTDEAVEEIRDMAGNGSGDIRIGSCGVFTEPSRLYAYNRRFFLAEPKISLHIYMMDTDRMENMLLSRDLDFGYSVTRPRQPDIGFEELFSYRLGLVVSRDHPMAGRGAVHLAEMADENFMCNNTSVDLRDSLYEMSHMAGFEPHVIFEGESPALIGDAVAAGRGVSFISNDQHAWKQENPGTQDERIVFLQLLDDFCVRTVYLLAVKDRYLSSAARKYRDGLLGFMQESAQ